METTIKIPDDLTLEFKKAILELGFSGDSEFIEQAIREKILELRKKNFFEITDKIEFGLKKRGVTHKDILEDFEKSKNEN